MKKMKKGFAVLLSTALAVTSMMDPAGSTALAKKAAKKQAKSIQVKSPFSAKDKKVTTTLTLKKGSTFKIKTAVSPKSAGKKLAYKSSKKKVASVSKSGKIKAKKVGKTKITVSPKGSKKVKAVIQVTVVKKLKKVKKIALDKSSLALSVNGNNRSAQLKASVTSPKKPTVKKFNWFTSNKKVATVSRTGVVTAKKTGSATITVTSADGRGAKAVCKVSVSGGTNPNPTESSKTPGKTPSRTSGVGPTGSNPGETSSPTPVPAKELTVVVPGNRTGINQGESIQLTAAGPGSDKVTWKVSELAGVTISEGGLLAVGADAKRGGSITITATTSADVAVKTATKALVIVENLNKPLAADQIQINKDTKENPLGLTYRDAGACTTVQDAERGEVIRFDASKGYTGSANDMLAWMVVDPAYAGKTVSISGYFKYEAAAGDLKDGKMNLIVNENWKHSNPANKYNVKPGEWCYVKGEYKVSSSMDSYDGNKNRFYIARSADHLNDGKNVVYYMYGLRFTIKKAAVSGVTLTAAGDATTVYQNNTLQFTSEVAGTNEPSQKVTYSIEPAVQGASIDDNGLLTVGKVAGNTKINVKAASVEDAGKSATKTITVLPQTVDSITVTAEGSPTEIYAGQPVQFGADVAVTGGADKSITWSVSPQTAGVAISDTGLLTVTDKVADNTALTVKATSKFDTAKSGQYEITVKENKVNQVTIKSAGNKTTVTSELPLNLSAEVNKVGMATDKVVWTIQGTVAGANLAFTEGKNNTLSVTSDVAVGTSITVRATSGYDSTKYAEITVTVEGETGDFDINTLTVSYWKDFNSVTVSELDEYLGNVISSSETPPDSTYWERWSMNKMNKMGLDDLSKSDKAAALRGTNTLRFCFNSENDYLQFELDNSEADSEKEFLVSFFARFAEIAKDTDERIANIAYELPLKLVSVNDAGKETILKNNIKLPYYCNTSSSTNKEYYEFFQKVVVPAGKKVYLRLAMNGELPDCQAGKTEADELCHGQKHPVVISIDNVAISSGKKTQQKEITLTKGDTLSLSVDKIEGDKVSFYTNCSLAKYTHDSKTPNASCTHLGEDTIVATVDESGTITATNAGETILIVEITHADGSVEHKQCIVHVDSQ